MLATEQVEELICMLATWNRATLLHQFKTIESSFPIDFSTDFLATLTDDRLRHIMLAICLQNQRVPGLPMIAA